MREFSQKDFKFILDGCFSSGDNDTLKHFLKFSPAGVDIEQTLPDSEIYQGQHFSTLKWKPVHDLVGPDKPPSTSPALPFPFTAEELAAFMLDGWGFFLQDVYGRWDSGPNESVRRGWIGDATDASIALQQAYRALKEAAKVVSVPVEGLQNSELHLRRALDDADNFAAKREGVFEAGITKAEREARRAQAAHSTKDLLRQHAEVSAAADELRIAWRKQMVQQLLQARSAEALTEKTEASPLETAVVPSWILVRPKRFPGYRAQLYSLLGAAHAAGKSRPTAFEVLDEWARRPPPGILEVLDGEVKYVDAQGRVRTASAEALRKTIIRMTTP